MEDLLQEARNNATVSNTPCPEEPAILRDKQSMSRDKDFTQDRSISTYQVSCFQVLDPAHCTAVVAQVTKDWNYKKSSSHDIIKKKKSVFSLTTTSVIDERYIGPASQCFVSQKRAKKIDKVRIF